MYLEDAWAEFPVPSFTCENVSIDLEFQNDSYSKLRSHSGMLFHSARQAPYPHLVFKS